MKKSLIFLIMAAFLASVAFGAPAKNATTGGGNKASSAKKAKAKTPSKKSKARKSVDETQETRGKQGQLGLMPSELDKANHNVYYADADAIRGARDTESALRYIPFVTITNTAGFGQAFDFRSQGRVSANGVKFFINGIAANPLDNYYGFMPINSVLPNLIQEIKVYPGSGAVLYGSGAKGAVLDIITSKRQKPYYLVGAGYVNTTGGDNSYYGVAQAAEKFGAVRLNAGLGYSQKGGPREDDNTQSIQAVLGGDYELFLGSSIFADVDFYNGKIKSTPYNSFWDTASIEARITAAGATEEAQKKPIALATKPIDPEQTNRSTKGDGEIQSKQTRLTASLGYTSEVTRDLKWELLGFFALDNRKYDIYTARIPFYQYGDKTFTGTGEKSNIADQSGSQFNEMKFGGKFKANLRHNNGEFLFGIDSYYEKAKRNAKQNLQSASIDPAIMYSGILVNIDNTLNLSKWTNALYGVERYDFNNFFSIAGGLRYEMTKYRSESNDYVYARIKNINADGSEQTNYKETKDPAIPPKSLKQDTGNFVFELAPAFRYSDTGVVYARYERGYTTLPPYAMSDRKGNINLDTNSPTAFSHNFTYEDTNLKDETYNTYELGWKEFIGKESLYFADGLFFSLNGFYTESKNEFYFTGDPYVGVKYGTYDKSRRYGGEAAFEQYFLDGVIGFNESFTYVKAQYQDDISGEWKQIPYTYDYKATFGAALNITAMVEIIDVNLGVWLQNSFYGKQKVSYSEFDPITKGVVSDDEKKLAPYLVSDLGISVGFNKNMGVITVGIKNVFDTFYYDYYNHDLNSAIGEYRYLIGQGRTVFLEGQFKY